MRSFQSYLFRRGAQPYAAGTRPDRVRRPLTAEELADPAPRVTAQPIAPGQAGVFDPSKLGPRLAEPPAGGGSSFVRGAEKQSAYLRARRADPAFQRLIARNQQAGEQRAAEGRNRVNAVRAARGELEVPLASVLQGGAAAPDPAALARPVPLDTDPATVDPSELTDGQVYALPDGGFARWDAQPGLMSGVQWDAQARDWAGASDPLAKERVRVAGKELEWSSRQRFERARIDNEIAAIWASDAVKDEEKPALVEKKEREKANMGPPLGERNTPPIDQQYEQAVHWAEDRNSGKMLPFSPDGRGGFRVVAGYSLPDEPRAARGTESRQAPGLADLSPREFARQYDEATEAVQARRDLKDDTDPTEDEVFAEMDARAQRLERFRQRATGQATGGTPPAATGGTSDDADSTAAPGSIPGMATDRAFAADGTPVYEVPGMGWVYEDGEAFQ